MIEFMDCERTKEGKQMNPEGEQNKTKYTFEQLFSIPVLGPVTPKAYKPKKI